MKAIGKKDWAFSAGNIPMPTTGKEPEMTSHDKIAILNTSKKQAHLELLIFYEDHPPVTGYSLKVESGRLRKIRFNDLIDPFPVPLEKNYSCLIQSNIAVVVQFSRMNTGDRTIAEMGTMAFPVDP